MSSPTHPSVGYSSVLVTTTRGAAAGGQAAEPAVQIYSSLRYSALTVPSVCSHPTVYVPTCEQPASLHAELSAATRCHVLGT